jgi:hypothetical protein
LKNLYDRSNLLFGEGWEPIPREKTGVIVMSTYRTQTDKMIRSAVWSQILLGMLIAATFYGLAVLDLGFKIFEATAGQLAFWGIAFSVVIGCSIAATMTIYLIFERMAGPAACGTHIR